MNNQKEFKLFAELAEKQRKIKADMPPVSYEEARATIKWLKKQRKEALNKRER